MRVWKRLTAAAVLAAATGLGAGLHDEDRSMTLSAVQAGPQRYAFTVDSGPVGDLYPGADRRLELTMDNPYGFDLTVTGLHAEIVSTSEPGCAPVPANLQVRAYMGALPVRIAAHDRVRTGTVPLHMPNTVVDACQRATFAITLTADAARS